MVSHQKDKSYNFPSVYNIVIAAIIYDIPNEDFGMIIIIALSLVSRDHSLGSTFEPQTIHYNHYCMGIKFNEELANNCYHIGVSSAQSTGYLFIFGDIFRITKSSSNYCLGHIHIKRNSPTAVKLWIY